MLVLRNLAIGGLAALTLATSTASIVAYRKNQESRRRLESAFHMGVNSLESIEQLRTLPAASKVRRALSEGNRRRLLQELAPDLSRTDARLLSRDALSNVFDAEEAMTGADLQRSAALLEQAKRIYQAHSEHYWALSGLSDVFGRQARLASMRDDQELNAVCSVHCPDAPGSAVPSQAPALGRPLASRRAPTSVDERGRSKRMSSRHGYLARSWKFR